MSIFSKTSTRAEATLLLKPHNPSQSRTKNGLLKEPHNFSSKMARCGNEEAASPLYL
jgi:hypothetical protein